jgi:hypothetical protein
MGSIIRAVDVKIPAAGMIGGIPRKRCPKIPAVAAVMKDPSIQLARLEGHNIGFPSGDGSNTRSPAPMMSDRQSRRMMRDARRGLSDA